MTKKITDETVQFTHLHLSGFGWENTIYLPSDFDRVTKLSNIGKSDGYQWFSAFKGKTHYLLRGHFIKL